MCIRDSYEPLDITLDAHMTEVEQIALLRWYPKRSWRLIRDEDLEVTNERLNELRQLEAYTDAVIQLLRSDIQGLKWRSYISEFRLIDSSTNFASERPRKFIKRKFGLGEYQLSRVISAVMKCNVDSD